MKRFLTADLILPVSGPPMHQSLLVCDEEGTILNIIPEGSVPHEQVEHYHGILCPGFVNAHCHLELSHLKGLAPQHTGLVDFLIHVQSKRFTAPEEILIAMEKAEEEMLRNGIVATGDVSNNALSFQVKHKQKLYYHTFIELIGINPSFAEDIFENGKQLQEKAGDLPVSLSAHAPYSVSEKLFRKIADQEGMVSVHNQESPEEDLFISKMEGDFLRLYKTLGIPVHEYMPSGKSALQTWLPYTRDQKVLSVHNTFTSEADLHFSMDYPNLYWCLCPRANLYIENTLPDIPGIAAHSDRICLGTDSLASNQSLSILSEMQVIQKYFPALEFNQLLKWGSLNGAEFLGISGSYGSFEIGKKPGINLISGIDPIELKINEDTLISRIL